MAVAVDIADLAAGQWGLFTAAQALQQGATHQALSHLIRTGSIERLAHGIYRVTGAPANPLDELRGAWLALDPHHTASERIRHHHPAVVSHRSAAVVYQLGDLEADRHEFTTAQRKQSRRNDIRMHRGVVEQGAWNVVDGLPVTTVLRTCLDLAHSGIDGGHLGGVLRDAIIKGHLDMDELTEAMRPVAHRYGARLGDGQAMVTSLLEQSGHRPVTLREQIFVGDELKVSKTLVDLATQMAVVDAIGQSPGFRVMVEALQTQLSGVGDEVARTAAQALSPALSEALRTLANAQLSITSPAIEAVNKAAASSLATHLPALEASAARAIVAATKDGPRTPNTAKTSKRG